MQPFRGRVLDRSHVELKAAAVKEKAAVARRFLVIAVMQIDRPGVGFAEQVIFNLCRPKLRIHVRLVFAEKTTVLGFDSDDSIHSNQITRRTASWLSQKESPGKAQRAKHTSDPIFPAPGTLLSTALPGGSLQLYLNFTVAHGTRLPRHPKIKEITNSTRNITNRSFAMPADAAAIPPNPKTAATSAMIRNTTAHPNIPSPPHRLNRICRLGRVPPHACSRSDIRSDFNDLPQLDTSLCLERR